MQPDTGDLINFVYPAFSLPFPVIILKKNLNLYGNHDLNKISNSEKN